MSLEKLTTAMCMLHVMYVLIMINKSSYLVPWQLHTQPELLPVAVGIGNDNRPLDLQIITE